MADYPNSVTNQKTTFANNSPFAEELITKGLNRPNSEINAIETELGITPKAAALATPGATATTVENLLGQIKQMLKNITGEANWYTTVSTTLASLFAFFNATTGHGHTGAANDSPQLAAGGIASNAVTTAKILDGNVTEAKIAADAQTGWTLADETWTYASASTITVPTGAASKYAVGDRIKWTQTTVKYGVIVSVADTLLTIAVNTDYVVTNAAISGNYYSHAETPIGFPLWFNFAPSFGNIAVVDGTVWSQYTISGRKITIHLNYIKGSSDTTGGTMAFNPDATWTVNSGIANTGYYQLGYGIAFDTSASATYPLVVRWVSTPRFQFYMHKSDGTYALSDTVLNGTVPFTWATGDVLAITCIYEI